MTILGEMIWNDGMEQGMARGVAQGIEEKSRNIVSNMIKRNMRDEDICAVAECDQEFVDKMRREIRENGI